VHEGQGNYFAADLDGCKNKLDCMGSDAQILWKEHWGKDASVQRCMELHEAAKVFKFHIDKDSLCSSGDTWVTGTAMPSTNAKVNFLEFSAVLGMGEEGKPDCVNDIQTSENQPSVNFRGWN